jgi:hypothetical protein
MDITMANVTIDPNATVVFAKANACPLLKPGGSRPDTRKKPLVIAAAFVLGITVN